MPSDEVFRISDALCTGETGAAIRVEASFFDDLTDDSSVWIPKYVVHDDSEVYEEGTDGELVVYHWFAEKKWWI